METLTYDEAERSQRIARRVQCKRTSLNSARDAGQVLVEQILVEHTITFITVQDLESCRQLHISRPAPHISHAPCRSGSIVQVFSPCMNRLTSFVLQGVCAAGGNVCHSCAHLTRELYMYDWMLRLHGRR